MRQRTSFSIGKRRIFLEGLGASEAERDPALEREEREADRFASHLLIPPPFDAELPHLSFNEIVPFAQRVGVSAAIVVGRLQHDGHLPYTHGNKLRQQLEFVPDAD